MRLETRLLVRSLDFRGFAVAPSGLHLTEAGGRVASESLRALPRVFPRLICLLLDGHPDLDPGSLVRTAVGPEGGAEQSLQLLDLAHCPHQLTTRYFASKLFTDLIYLDISCIPGSLGGVVQSSLNPEHLPELRVLRARGREMDDTTATCLFQKFGRQLWSLDISDNKLTNATIQMLVELCFPRLSFRSDARFETEGKLVNPGELGCGTYGAYQFIEESTLSATFNHPERHIADAPPYGGQGDLRDLQEWQVVRSNGTERRRDDTVDTVRRLLLDDALMGSVSSKAMVNHRVRAVRGATHLYLNGNRFSTFAIQKLLRITMGGLEHLECDSCHFSSPNLRVPPSLPRSIRIYGLWGAAHLFRPVFSSSMRSLRVHHSLVTQIPSISADGFSPVIACIHAETVFRDRIRMAYPQPFVPDMNPRLISLTLTGIPARSLGPLISSLTNFLDHATEQHNAISETSISSTRHGSSVLSGLQHIRLELEPEHSDDLPIILAGGEDNFAETLSPAMSPTGDTEPGPSDASPEMSNEESYLKTGRSSRSSSQNEPPTTESVDAPNPDAARIPGPEHVTHRVQASESSSGNVFSVPVWVGNGVPSPHPAVNEYMAKLRDSHLHADVGPAMPHHVAAGVPPGSYVFNAAWDSICFPDQLPDVDKASVRDLRDVATAIKSYRQQTKGTSRHWMGRLELARSDAASRYLTSEYWR